MPGGARRPEGRLYRALRHPRFRRLQRGFGLESFLQAFVFLAGTFLRLHCWRFWPEIPIGFQQATLDSIVVFLRAQWVFVPKHNEGQ